VSGANDAYVRFLVGQELYALPLREVREVIPAVPLTPVPAAPSFALGVFNHHGRAIFLVELQALLESQVQGSRPPAGGDAEAPAMCVLLDQEDRHMALGVDQIEGIGALTQSGGIAQHEGRAVSVLSCASLTVTVDLAFESGAVLESGTH